MQIYQLAILEVRRPNRFHLTKTKVMARPGSLWSLRQTPFPYLPQLQEAIHILGLWPFPPRQPYQPLLLFDSDPPASLL